MKFKFECVCTYTDSKITKEFDAENLGDVLREFKEFLQGAGYSIEGELCVEERLIEPKDV